MRVSIAQAVHLLPTSPSPAYPHGEPFVSLMQHGSMRMEVFAPSTSRLGIDVQQPHAQDELYFIYRGKSDIVIHQQRFDAAPGDAFFVAAGTPHHFENFSHDFVTWVVFYGPQGGEKA